MASTTLLLCYVGPGGALSALGSLLALLAALVLALIGFVWYPIRRLLRAVRGRSRAPQDSRSVAH